MVLGNAGNNVINGGDGRDELTGLGGQDSFLFDTLLNVAFNVDVITDFNVADDTIRLDDDIFSSDLLAGNSVADSQFVIGAAALDAGDRIIYNSASGAVYYDSDGTGAAAQIQFAQLSPGLGRLTSTSWSWPRPTLQKDDPAQAGSPFLTILGMNLLPGISIASSGVLLGWLLRWAFHELLLGSRRDPRRGLLHSAQFEPRPRSA